MFSPRESLITLNLIPGLGSLRIQSLLEFFSTADLVLEAPRHMLLQVPRIGEKIAAAISDWRNCTNITAELDLAERLGIRVLTILDDDYPDVLRRMRDAPIVLYVRGNLKPEDGKQAISIVGSRTASIYGITHARRFARELADFGCPIVSGLAKGADAAAHWGALDANGRTIAVLGNGLSHIWPPEHQELADRICDGHGALISEFPLCMRPSKTTFPQRNRIVAAWTKATLVVEAPLHSGALHTARLSAEEYGNSVFALPGPIDRPGSAGCHALIRDGATLCTRPQEILDDMGWSHEPKQMELFADERSGGFPQSPVIAAIRQGHATLDALCAALGMGARELTPQLMRLQVEGLIKPLPGCRFAATI